MVSYLAPQGFIPPLASSRLTPLSEMWALTIMYKDGHNDASKHTHQTLLYPCHFCLAGDAMGNSIMISISHMRKLRPRRASQQESSSGCGGGFKVETAPVSLPYIALQFTQAIHGLPLAFYPCRKRFSFLLCQILLRSSSLQDVLV